MKMIRFNAVLVAGLVVALGATSALAQSVAQVGRPAEQPPSSFGGQQYVDSRGCVFMRAGFAGQTNWVPRIGRDRKPICNEVTPAQAAARLAAGDQTSVAKGGTQTVGAPMKTVASGMASGQKTGVFTPTQVPGLNGTAAIAAAPKLPQPITAQPQTGYAAAPVPNVAVQAPNAARGSAQCPSNAPVLQRLPLSTGGTVAVCTRGDGSSTGWVSPSGTAVFSGKPDKLGFAGPQGSGAAYGAEPTSRVQTVIAGQAVIAPRREAQTYVAAWKDDRLNPNRGRGTAEGWANQSQVWTNTIPAQSRSDLAQGKVRTTLNTKIADAVRVSGSSMSAPAAAAGGRLYVQVGTFGQSANAQNAAGRLAGLGLPVASAKGKKGGQQLVSIMAGPFVSPAEAQSALNAARRAGFGDAFIR